MYTLRGPLYKNKEYRRFVWSQCIIWVFFLLLVFGFSSVIWNGLHEEMVTRNLALLGRLIHELPEEYHSDVESVVVSAFTQSFSQDELAKYQEIASSYGYTPQVPMNASPLIASAYNRWNRGFNWILILFLLGMSTLSWIIFSKVYHTIHALVQGAEGIMDGRFDVHFSDEGDGELDVLSFQFNQMAKRLEHTLAALEGEKSFLKEMISGVSHQLKTPLSSLKVYNELMLDQAGDEVATRREFLRESLGQIERMEWLIQTLLKLARLEANVITLECKPNIIDNTVNQVITQLKPRWQSKNQSVIFNPTRPLVELVYDAKWIAEVVENLIKNAIDYTPNDGQIEISVEQLDTSVRMRISDTGMGISEADIPYVFDRFYQGGANRKMHSAGSGIGLALAKLIVEKHSGFIDVKSKEFVGSTFTVVLPTLTEM